MKTKHILTLTILLSAAILFNGCMPHSTNATEVGELTVKWSPIGNKGVQENTYPPGATTFQPMFLVDWHTFDTRLQNIEMTEDPTRGDRQGRDELLFKTIDGNDIGLDVVFEYRIIPEKAPYILQKVARNDEELKEVIVRTITRSKPRDIFGELDTEEFYTAEKRTEKAEEVKVALNEILLDYGVIVERVSTNDYKFNDEYQMAIEEKKVADLEAEQLRSETLAKEKEFLTEVELAIAEIVKIKEKADGEYERAVIEADAYFDQQLLFADAIRAEGRAEAEGILRMNEALAGSGGEAMVKLEIADALKGKRIIMLPMGGGGLDVRSTDVNALLQLYGIQTLTSPKEKPPVEKPKNAPVQTKKAPVKTKK